MSRRNLKNYNTYQECYFKAQNEPEEGEIVDDYDLIVSSDEELSMRQRIRELEAENEEIEQIAVISRSYTDKISHPHYFLESSRAAQVPTDASSISSAEFVTPKKRKRQKSREHKRKHCHRQHQHEHERNHQYEPYLRYDPQKISLKARLRRSRCKRRQKLYAKKHQKNHSDRFINKGANPEALSLESPESSESSYLTDADNKFLEFKRKESFNNARYVTRDTLRLAVARNTSESSRYPFKKSCLKDKLQRQEFVGKSLNKFTNEQHGFSERNDFHDKNDDDDDDVQVIENEPDIQTVDENSTDSMEEKELRLIALKSAVLKKHMARKMRNAEVAYSPTDFDEMLSSSLLRQENKLDDIDIVDLEAEDSQTACVIVSPEASPQLMMLDDQDESQQMVDCKPVDMDIANSDSDSATVDNWAKDVELSFPKNTLDSHDFANNIQYRFYMQKLHEIPPPPPGVDDYDNVPPPPPYHLLYNTESQDMDLDKEELAEHQNCMTETVKNVVWDKQPKEETEDDEEEEALRALLLSKFQSPKNQRKTKFKDTSYKDEVVPQNNCQPKPTEIILKEAVKRLKTHSQPEHCKDENSIDICNNSQRCSRDKIQERPENNIGSLNPFKKSGNYINKYKNQPQSITTNQIKEDSDDGRLEQDRTEEISTDSNINVCNDQTKPNSLELTSTIDISDITRRLQKIKENVLNLTHNISPSHSESNLNSTPRVENISQPPSECFKIAGSLESNQTSLENVLQSNISSTNNLDNSVSANNELITASTKNKTVQANFDVTTNQTTFKVTITNNVAVKSENDYNETALNGVTCKETNTNVNVTNNLPLKVNGITTNKAALNSEKIVKVANKTTESNGKNKAAMQIVNDIKVNPTPLLRTTKIVKPNKVINTSFEVPLRQASQASESASALKPSLTETTDQLSNIADNSRLITSIDQVKHMCVVAPFVISVQNSSNESSEEEGGQDYDTFFKPLYDYNDNVSPLSLNLESPAQTPLRSNSPSEPCADGSTKQADLKTFNANKTKTTSLLKENVMNKTHLTNLSVHSDKINKTPLAVRHLPAAAQSEYRRLVHRMKLLENKRKLAKLEENLNECKTTKKNRKGLPATEDPCKEIDKVDDMNSVLKTSLVKKVLLRNANNNTTSTSAPAPAPVINTQLSSNGSNNSSSKVNKNNVLRSYENLYVKFGAGIVNNLDKSLKLVEEAKKVKIEKLKLENRLKELKAEMDILQAKHKEEQQKISKIYPSICTTNEVISSLKQKRSKVFKAALDLGKSLKGEDYRLNNDLKECITTKSKKLATEIKIVNLLKAQDVTSMNDVINPISEKHAENKTEKVEDSKMKSNKEKNNIDLNPNDNTNNAMIFPETRGEEEKKENNPEFPLKIDFGGNTEFQSLEPLKSKSHDITDDTCQPNKDTKLNTAHSPKRSNQTLSLSSYISPLEHLRNIDSNVDPNGIVCPYDLMGNCEDVTCKYVHLTAKAKT